MDCFIAKSDKQLGACLKLLYTEGYGKALVEPVLDGQGKMEFHIKAEMASDTFHKLQSQYKMLIS